ncbi:2-oxoglutarate dehydrogenase complex E2 component [Nowakowskiella sp. JEL0407]|nr:2-oxoglutarate dehydrogenase complex E2 component [Nowakowskiella sp. JEL0407]
MISPFSRRIIPGIARRSLRTNVLLSTASYSTVGSFTKYNYSSKLSRNLSHTVKSEIWNDSVLTSSLFNKPADKIFPVPPMAESITEGTLTKWHKKVGEYVSQDEVVATIETDKVDIPVNSPAAGTIVELFANEDDTVTVGGNLFRIELGGEAPAKSESTPPPASSAPPPPPPAASQKPAASTPTPPPPPPTPAAKVSIPPPQSPPGIISVLLKTDDVVKRDIFVLVQPKPAVVIPPPSSSSFDFESDIPGFLPGSRDERRVKMNRMRLRIAERLKDSQNTAASLTTFNEIDMSNVIDLRKQYKDAVLEKYGVKLGFMSIFLKAATYALKQVPEVNARIENGEIVYHDYMDVSVAVATPKGLVTPVIRNCEAMSIIQLEQAMAELAKKAKSNAITVEDMTGGTFTISNGGVFGSLMGTPIINQPQSAILGMHATKERAVVVNGQVVARPMMYIALTYDHRLIDGREAVTFLVKLKEVIEDPRRLLLEV